jgi:hypothetical protein
MARLTDRVLANDNLRVVNALWLVPAAVAAFVCAWRTKNGGNS